MTRQSVSMTQVAPLKEKLQVGLEVDLGADLEVGLEVGLGADFGYGANWDEAH